ncbi:hypothetical protein QE152_g41359, partial [Popillia japonica]
MCKEVLALLEVPITHPVKPVRLGMYDPTKTDRKRPVKVALGDKGLVSKALQNSRRLRSSTDFNFITISKDRTPRQ